MVQRGRAEGRQAGDPPGREPTDHVGGPVQADVLQRGGGQRRGVALLTEDHHRHVVVDGLRQPGRAAGVEAPLQHVALDDERARHHAVRGPLRGRADVDQQRSGPVRQVRPLRVQPVAAGRARRPGSRRCPGSPAAARGPDSARRLPALSVPSGDRVIVGCARSPGPAGLGDLGDPQPPVDQVIAGHPQQRRPVDVHADRRRRRLGWSPGARAGGRSGGRRRPGSSRGRSRPALTVSSVSTPLTTRNAPAEPPWSCRSVPCPGSQLSAHTSWSSPTARRRVPALGRVEAQRDRPAGRVGPPRRRR